MLREQTEALIRERGLATFSTFNDIDGPGIGNSGMVDKTERPNSGGIYNYLVGYKYPYKGQPNTDGVYNLHAVKKLFKLAIDHYTTKTIRVAIGLLIILPRWITKGFLKPIINHLYSWIDFRLYWDFLNPIRYCTCVREIDRTFTVFIDWRKDPIDTKILIIVKNLICMSLEYDSAYRFRLQDIMAETNKEKLLKDIRGEIKRLFDILLYRELEAVDMRNKFMKIRKILLMVLLIPGIRRIVRDFIKEMDIEKLKPDEGDKYFWYLRKDYDFFGKSLPERIEMRKKIDGENWVNFEPVANGFLMQYYGKK